MTPLEYLRGLTANVVTLNASLDQCLRSWSPAVPPDTVVFARIGDSISEAFPSLSSDERRRIFAAIETGVVSPDEALRTAMVTGMVESLVANTDRKPELWSEFEKLFGPASLKHAVWWRDFGG